MGTLADIADGYFIQPSKKFQRLQGADKPALTSRKAGEVRPLQTVQHTVTWYSTPLVHSQYQVGF